MGEKTSEKVAPFVKVHLSEFDFAVKDVSTALKAIFDKHRDKEEEAKVTSACPYLISPCSCTAC